MRTIVFPVTQVQAVNTRTFDRSVGFGLYLVLRQIRKSFPNHYHVGFEVHSKSYWPEIQSENMSDNDMCSFEAVEVTVITFSNILT